MIEAIHTNPAIIEPKLVAEQPQQKAKKVVLKALEEAVLTIYQNTAQIADRFSAEVGSGMTKLVYQPPFNQMDVSSTLVHIDQGNGEIVSQKFDPKSFSLGQFYKSLIGKDVSLETELGMVNGKLLEVYGDQWAVLNETGSLQFVSQKNIHSIQCKSLKQKVHQKPHLNATYDTQSAESINGQMIYLTQGLKWSPRYRLIIEEQEEGITATLKADAQITNQTNSPLKNVIVKVVSGHLNLENNRPTPVPMYAEMRKMAVDNASSGAAAVQQAWKDYKAYLIPYKVNLEPSQTISTKLFETKEVSLDKSYELHSHDQQSYHKHPEIYYHLENNEENQLDQALPGGKIQAYSKTDSGVDFIGESSIEHTPCGKNLKINTGQCFDLMVDRSVEVRNIKVASKLVAQEMSVKIQISNGSCQDRIVNLVEHLNGDVKVRESSLPFSQETFNEKEFEVTVPAKTSFEKPLEVTYTYRREFN